VGTDSDPHTTYYREMFEGVRTPSRYAYTYGVQNTYEIWPHLRGTVTSYSSTDATSYSYTHLLYKVQPRLRGTRTATPTGCNCNHTPTRYIYNYELHLLLRCTTTPCNSSQIRPQTVRNTTPARTQCCARSGSESKWSGSATLPTMKTTCRLLLGDYLKIF
jgi:hypothetical protein